MTWLGLLSKTYDQIMEMGPGVVTEIQKDRLLPISHSRQKAHVEVTLEADGDFDKAEIIPKEDQETLIPVTEKSAARTSGIAPHPLHDKLQYVAGDFNQCLHKPGDLTEKEEKKYNRDLRKNEKSHQAYLDLLGAWCEFDPDNFLIQAVFKYVSSKQLIHDLFEAEILDFDDENELVVREDDEKKTKKPRKNNPYGQNSKNLFIRFSVRDDDDDVVKPWENARIFKSYIDFYESLQKDKGLDYTTGNYQALTNNHPKRIRGSWDSAKLLSSNDTSGFTFKGRFINSDEAGQVSYETSQKAHNALKYLINKQGTFIGSRLFLISGSSGQEVPNPMENTLQLVEANQEKEETEKKTKKGKKKTTYHFVGSLAHELNRALWGKQHSFNYSDSIFIMILDSASPGRLSVVYFREFTGADKDRLFKNIENWHNDLAWYRTDYLPKTEEFYSYIGAPSLKQIVATCYGTEQNKRLVVNEKLYPPAITRLYPLVINGHGKIPFDMVRTAYNRARYPLFYTKNVWLRVRSTACSLIKAYLKQYKNEDWRFEVDQESKDLAYNLGRYLAVLHQIEYRALRGNNRDVKRPTNAIRYFSKVIDQPAKTIGLLSQLIQPYRASLGEKGNDLYKMAGEISSLIDPEEFAAARNLDGRFLLGFDSQQHAIIHRNKQKKEEKED